MVSLKPFKGTRPFNEDAINIIAPSTDHLTEENIDLLSNKNSFMQEMSILAK